MRFQGTRIIHYSWSTSLLFLTFIFVNQITTFLNSVLKHYSSPLTSSSFVTWMVAMNLFVLLPPASLCNNSINLPPGYWEIISETILSVHTVLNSIQSFTVRLHSPLPFFFSVPLQEFYTLIKWSLQGFYASIKPLYLGPILLASGLC